MRNLNLLLFLATSLFWSPLFAQNLSMAQILELKNKTVGEAEEYLTSKGWEFYIVKKPEDDKMGMLFYGWGISYDKSQAEAWIKYSWIYDEQGQYVTRILLEIHNQKKYIEYLNAIKSYGCKLISTDVVDGKMIKIYRGKTTSFKLVTQMAKEGEPMWELHVHSNNDNY